MKRRYWILATLMLGLTGCSHAQTRAQAADENDRDDVEKLVRVVGDVTEVASFFGTPISGVGLVGGLEGSGGGVPNDEFRKMLEDQLHKYNKVEKVKELLESPNYTMVLVNGKIPAGIRKGEQFDVEITLPPKSKATSLRGGYLHDCPLIDYETRQNAKGAMGLLKGHTLAKASGPLLVGFGEGAEEVKLRRGMIYDGGVSQIDAPFVLCLKNDSRQASVANTIAIRINSAFPDDAKKQYLLRQAKRLMVLDEVASGINEKFHGPNGLGRGETAQALGKDAIYVNVPLEYKLNPARYLLVVRLIPLRENAEMVGRYRKRLHEMLLDPKDTVRAALRLEALGKESIPALKKGLASDVSLVRFASAEALTYLGNTAGVEELTRLAEKYPSLRGNCFTALASLNESLTHAKLGELMRSSEPQVRIGAFRALLALTDTAPRSGAAYQVQGAFLNDAFWLHHVAPASASMVHIANRRRAEIVIFGEEPKLLPPLRISAGSEFTITAEIGDDRCTVNRYRINAGKDDHLQCNFQLKSVLQKIAEMGGQYPDVVALLSQLEREKRLSCAVLTEVFPATSPVDLLAACGCDASKFKDNPEFQQEVLTAQEELGMLRSDNAKSEIRTTSSETNPNTK